MPLIDALEPRRLLSASLHGGVLSIMGTSEADHIELSHPTLGKPRNDRVSPNTSITFVDINQDHFSFKTRSIHRIIINARGGDDFIKIGQTPPDDPCGSLAITVHPDPLHFVPALRTLIFGKSGDDTILASSGPDRILGGDGADSIMGLDGNDRIYGEAGDDSLSGGWGNDFVSGGDGNDGLGGGAGNDRLFGKAGDDYFERGDKDTQFGGDGNDQLFGLDGENNLRGGAGDDTINGNIATDIMSGGEGNDLANIYNANPDNPSGIGFWDFERLASISDSRCK